MPWLPELFSAPALERIERDAGHELVAVPYFEGLLADELDALTESFADEPELHHPVRGRIKGARAFTALAVETRAWLTDRNVEVEASRMRSRSTTALRRSCRTWTATTGGSRFPSH